jgi:hypothetical protein
MNWPKKLHPHWDDRRELEPYEELLAIVEVDAAICITGDLTVCYFSNGP